MIHEWELVSAVEAADEILAVLRGLTRVVTVKFDAVQRTLMINKK